jgi:hypothetical protein
MREFRDHDRSVHSNLPARQRDRGAGWYWAEAAVIGSIVIAGYLALVWTGLGWMAEHLF